jgi:hypothetical protein
MEIHPLGAAWMGLGAAMLMLSFLEQKIILASVVLVLTVGLVLRGYFAQNDAHDWGRLF